MIQFHTFGMPELWLNPWVGQPPALWYSGKGPDDRQDDHAEGCLSMPASKAAPALDLLDRLAACEPLVSGRSVCGLAVEDVVPHHDRLLRLTATRCA
jgi:hypothetical protein